ncbi:MAG: murein L,D-transpeptidase family protein [Terriglobia bacterium]
MKRISTVCAIVLALAAQGGRAQQGPVAGNHGTASKETADKIVVFKKQRTMQLLSQGRILKTYKIALGGNPVGPKQMQGDHKTPEGAYTIDSRNSKSQFYLALHISYPNADDRARARRLGMSPGGAIMIHGLGKKFGWIGSSHTLTDWTDGCIAVTNEEIEEIWRLVPLRTPVEILP